MIFSCASTSTRTLAFWTAPALSFCCIVSWIRAFAYRDTVHTHTMVRNRWGFNQFTLLLRNVSATLIPQELPLGCLVKNCKEHRFSQLKQPLFCSVLYSGSESSLHCKKKINKKNTHMQISKPNQIIYSIHLITHMQHKTTCGMYRNALQIQKSANSDTHYNFLF